MKPWEYWLIVPALLIPLMAVAIHYERKPRMPAKLVEVKNIGTNQYEIIHSGNIGVAFTNLAREYFMDGVVAAIYAHNKWLNLELRKGVVPDPTGMGLKEWKAAATQAWIEANPNEAYIK